MEMLLTRQWLMRWRRHLRNNVCVNNLFAVKKIKLNIYSDFRAVVMPVNRRACLSRIYTFVVDLLEVVTDVRLQLFILSVLHTFKFNTFISNAYKFNSAGITRC